MELPPDTAFVHIRDYYFDWQPGEPATFVLERVDDPADPKPARTSERVAAMLADAAGEIEHSFAFWSGYQERMLKGQAANSFTEPGGAAGGVQAITYSHAGCRARAGRGARGRTRRRRSAALGRPALQPPVVRGARLRVSEHEHEPSHGRKGSRRHVRVVIAARDTGAANWLDTEGRDAVLATVRWWNALAAPTVRARVVPVSDVGGPVGPDQRRAADPPPRRPCRLEISHLN